MPAAYDIYADQLRELRRGQALYYPEPSSEEGPVEIGDVGYTKQGAFCRLFNVSRSADDPAQLLGVPDGFEPLNMGRIRTFEAALEPGPLHSKTIYRVNADIGSPGAVLPAEASFRFSCTSTRGAILMLETQMIRQQALHETLFKNYLLQHCLSWYNFARDLGVQVEFGDIMLVTECSKTAAWASAVYSQSSKEFGMSFSAGGAFLPSGGGVSASAGLERIGPVEYRRSQRRAVTIPDVQSAVHDQTVFIKAYRLGSRSLYLRSLASKIMRTKNRSRQLEDSDQYDTPPTSPRRVTRNNQSNSSQQSPFRSTQFCGDSAEIVSSLSDKSTFLFPEWPDFHPSVALLAHAMETTDVEIAAVHDNEWCSAYSGETGRIIDAYAQRFFSEDFLERKDGIPIICSSSGLFLPAYQKSITASEEAAKFELLRGEGVVDVGPGTSPLAMSKIPQPNLPVPSKISLTPQRKSRKESIKPTQETLKTKTPVSAPTTPTELSDNWKITLLGDGGVGKTALAVQFTMNAFIGKLTYDPTIEDTYTRLLPVDQQKCQIQIIDTAGQKEYATLIDQWIRQGQAFALVYSVASRETFERIESFRQSLLRLKRCDPCFVLVGNKVDKFYEREVSIEEGEKLAEAFGCEYIEASAKTGISVQKVFFDLVRILRGTRPMGMSEKPHTSPVAHKSSKKGCVLM